MSICSQNIERKRNSDVNQGSYTCCIRLYLVARTDHKEYVSSLWMPLWSRSQSEIYRLFLKFVSPPRKKNLVTVSVQGHVSGS